MRHYLRATTWVAAGLVIAGPAALHAGGLDRTGQPIDLLFEDGNYATFGFSQTIPSLSGTGTGRVARTPFNPTGAIGAGTGYSDVGQDFDSVTAGVKLQLTDDVSAALLFSQPFGAGIEYGGDSDSTELGGTFAKADTDMLTAILRYKLDETWSVHGGVRIERASGQIGLSGLAYGAPQAAIPPGAPAFAGGFNGYSVDLEERIDVGWLVGFAYEIPDIALRLAVTYNSPITHKFDTTEFYLGRVIGESETEVSLPQSLNIDFQTGIAEDTLLFANYRFAEWSEFKIEPELFTPAAQQGLVNLRDYHTFTLGLGRQFTDRFAASAAMTYEATVSEDLVSPLDPTNGLFAISLGGAYDVTEDVTVSGGVRYTWIGNARAETGTPDTARAVFEDNSAVSVGFSVGYRF